MASTARHDALLDLRRSAPSDLPQRWEGGRAGASCDPSAAAVRLKAVVELYAVFKEIAGEALGGRKCHSHFEQWLWACRVDPLERSGRLRARRVERRGRQRGIGSLLPGWDSRRVASEQVPG